MLSMPIKAPSGEVIGVAQVINKIGSKDRHEAFTDSDEKVSQYNVYFLYSFPANFKTFWFFFVKEHSNSHHFY